MSKHSFFGELRRRSVFKVMVAYLVVAWLHVQVVDTAQPALHLPEWTGTFIWVMLIVGFPIALLLAWAYDLTPEGIQRTRYDDAGGRTSGSDTSLPARVQRLPDVSDALASVCVLPFKNLVVSAEHRYLADAMTLELQSLLSSCRDLRVVSNQSAAAQSAAGSDLQAIARRLGVQYVITGSIATMGSKYRVTAELVDALTDAVLWAEHFDIEIEGIWETQSRIAETIVGTFGGARLRNEVAHAVAAEAPANNARLLVQQARAYLLDYGPDTIAEALAPNDPIVLRAPGCVHAYIGDYVRSLDLLHRAVKLAPFDLGARGYLGWPLVASGRPEHLEELHEIMDHLLATAPQHPGRAYWQFHTSVALVCADRAKEALPLDDELTLEQPGFALGLMHHANTLGGLGRGEQARAAAARVRPSTRA